MTVFHVDQGSLEHERDGYLGWVGCKKRAFFFVWNRRGTERTSVYLFLFYFCCCTLHYPYTFAIYIFFVLLSLFCLSFLQDFLLPIFCANFFVVVHLGVERWQLRELIGFRFFPCSFCSSCQGLICAQSEGEQDFFLIPPTSISCTAACL